jgi:uncharacterized protein (UPF0335 family)
MTEKEAIEKFVKLFMEEESLKEQIKEVADEAKEEGYAVTSLKAVAKAIVTSKVDELIEKSESVIRLAELS